MSTTATASSPAPPTLTSGGVKTSLSLRKNGRPPTSFHPPTLNRTNINLLGKNWHVNKPAFRPTAGQTIYAKRAAAQAASAATKAKEREMKGEKQAERQGRIQAIKDKRAAKEERERYEKMAEKMHKRRVERVKRREKRNKLLKS